MVRGRGAWGRDEVHQAGIGPRCGLRGDGGWGGGRHEGRERGGMVGEGGAARAGGRGKGGGARAGGP